MESSIVFQQLNLVRIPPFVTIVTKLTEKEPSVAIRLPQQDTEHAVFSTSSPPRNSEFLRESRLGLTRSDTPKRACSGDRSSSGIMMRNGVVNLFLEPEVLK